MNVTRRLFAGALVLMALCGMGRLQADPIIRVDGQYTQSDPSPDIFDVQTFSLIDGTASFVVGPSGFDASSLEITVTNFTTTDPRIDFGTPQLIISLVGFPSTRAIFNIATPGRVVSNNPDYFGTNPTAEFATNVSLVSNTIPGLDLRRFATGQLLISFDSAPAEGGFQFTPGGADGGDQDGNGDITGFGPANGDPGTVDIFGTIRANFVIVGTSDIPEPATVTLLGVAAVGGAGAMLRRWRRNK